LGIVPYREVWELQKQLQRSLIDGADQDTILVCQHPPTITAGRATKPENLLTDPESLRSQGIEYYEIERGGDLTYHGPGQIVVYPILNLARYRRDVGWYMRTLEESVIQSCLEYGIVAVRYPGRTGVWIDAGPEVSPRWRKISSQGVRISRWCTLHGIACNVTETGAGFRQINPCGYTDVGITSVAAELSTDDCPAVEEFGEVITSHLTGLLREASSLQPSSRGSRTEGTG
jgi:lipoyl(octanoyl) transferase